MKQADGTCLAIEPGSLVVVSGADGNIGSHVVDQLLASGYRVRGTVRSLAKKGWAVDHFAAKYGPGKMELAEVQDMGAAGAFDEAVRGAAGSIHVATPVMQHSDPNVAIPTVVQGATNMLSAAAAEPGMRRVVMTSSSGACSAPRPDEVFTIGSATWNEEAVRAAWGSPPKDALQRKLDVYYAAKTQGEQAAWRWMDEHKPGFVLNTVLPNANFGPVQSAEHQSYHSTLAWIKAAWDGFEGDGGAEVKDQPPQYYVNIVDNAMVHVAALVYPDVAGERLFTFAHPYNWNDVLAVFRKLYPNRKTYADLPGLGRDRSKVANQRAEELLRRYSGHGWTDLEDTIKQSIEGYCSQ